MRLFEILQEGYNQELESDLNNLLVSAIGAGAKDIRTTDLVRQLRSAGYSVGTNSLLSLLSNNPAVSNATPDMITFNEPSYDSSTDDATQDSAEKVKSLAAKATKIG